MTTALFNLLIMIIIALLVSVLWDFGKRAIVGQTDSMPGASIVNLIMGPDLKPLPTAQEVYDYDRKNPWNGNFTLCDRCGRMILDEKWPNGSGGGACPECGWDHRTMTRPAAETRRDDDFTKEIRHQAWLHRKLPEPGDYSMMGGTGMKECNYETSEGFKSFDTFEEGEAWLKGYLARHYEEIEERKAKAEQEHKEKIARAALQ